MLHMTEMVTEEGEYLLCLSADPNAHHIEKG